MCGTAFQTRSRRALYCSGRCSKRRQRTGRPAQEVRSVREQQAVGEGDSSPLADAVRADLAAAGREGSARAAQAVLVALRLGQSMLDNPSGVAALSKELDRLMVQLLKDTRPEPDLLDEIHGNVVSLRDRRSRRTAGGGA